MHASCMDDHKSNFAHTINRQVTSCGRWVTDLIKLNLKPGSCIDMGHASSFLNKCQYPCQVLSTIYYCMFSVYKQRHELTITGIRMILIYTCMYIIKATDIPTPFNDSRIICHIFQWNSGDILQIQHSSYHHYSQFIAQIHTCSAYLASIWCHLARMILTSYEQTWHCESLTASLFATALCVRYSSCRKYTGSSNWPAFPNLSLSKSSLYMKY